MFYYFHGNIDVITLSNKIYNFQDKVKYNNLIRRQDILLQKEILYINFSLSDILFCIAATYSVKRKE